MVNETWLAGRWVTAAGFMAGALILALPLIVSAFALSLVLIFLHSPAYMIHQVEEHTRDRFRTFINDAGFGGRDALSVAAVLVINLPLVWGLNLASLYAAFLWGDGYGLAAPYAMLVNGIVHIGATARFRRYNPGLVTGIVLFLPLSIATILTVDAEIGFHVAGLLIAVLVHAVIVLTVFARARRIGAWPPASRQAGT
jgi:hypothetical protein